MAWTLEDAKARLNIAATDTSQDDAVALSMEAALDLVEAEVGRPLALASEREVFLDWRSEQLTLRRWPVDAASIVLNYPLYTGIYPRTRWDLARGIIRDTAFVGAPRIEIDYIGGYFPFPSDLEWALWQVFDGVHGSGNAVAGGSGSVAITGSGEIKSLQLYDVGNITYDVGTTVVGGADEAPGGILGRLTDPVLRFNTILDKYRTHVAVVV